MKRKRIRNERNDSARMRQANRQYGTNYKRRWKTGMIGYEIERRCVEFNYFQGCG